MGFLVSFLLVFVAANGGAALHLEDMAMLFPLLGSVIYHPCPPNEMWQRCAANCSDCQRRGNCQVAECLPGCDCLPMYFRIEVGGPCVPVSRCPRPEWCGQNEVFRECGPACERCGAPRCRTMSCDHRCYCREGHLRDDRGECVPQRLCHPTRTTCGHNEEWRERGRADEYCLGSGNETIQEVPGCYCKEGLRRNNALGSCVTSCDRVRCYGSSQYHACVPRCNATCRSDPSWCSEEAEDCFPGCFCSPGSVMNDFNNCIPQANCSTDAPPVVKVERGMGLMVDDDSETTTTPGGETTTSPGSAEDGRNSSPSSSSAQTSEPTTTAESTEKTTEDSANEDI